MQPVSQASTTVSEYQSQAGQIDFQSGMSMYRVAQLVHALHNAKNVASTCLQILK